ncbi:MAG: YitT family protein [Clostridia bacterium]|nr:YitT family protein [Clostridia bacterium]
MKSTKERIRDYIIITIGTIIASFSVFFFLTPSHLAVGSISGLAVLIAKFVPMTVGTLLIILNGICLLLSAIFVGKEFTYRTLYPSILLPIVIRILEKIYPNMQSLMGDQFLDMLGYLFLYALGASLLFMNNASSGGLDVITKIMNKYFHMELGTAMSVCGMAVAIPSIFIYDIKTGLLSILGTYFQGIILDHFLFGFSIKKKVCVVSDHIEEIRDYVINVMHSGATFYEATGAFDYRNYKELNIIVNRQEYVTLINLIDKVDPDAFVSVYNVSEIMSHTWGRKGGSQNASGK